MCAEQTGPGRLVMNTDTTFLPQRKRQELDDIVATVREHEDVEMIILFGSHARNEWVEDVTMEDGKVLSFKSDFDILLVTADKRQQKHIEHDSPISDLFDGIDVDLTPINYIVHTVGYLNQMFAERRYFFMDVARDGILLYDSQRHTLEEPPSALLPTERLAQAQDYFEECMEQYKSHLKFAAFGRNTDELHLGAFHLHQCAETLYSTIDLVLSGYKPKGHNLKKIEKRVVIHAPELFNIFPRDTKEQRRRLDLLRRAYVDARYRRKTYRITETELDWLADRIQQLETATQTLCQTHIQTLQSQASPG